jgi:hypothetical protein
MSVSSPTLKSVYEEFLKFEDEFSLFNAKISGVLFWERIRYEVFSAITVKYAEVKIRRRKRVERKEEQKVVLFYRKFRNYLKVLLEFRLNPLLAKKHAILVLNTSKRKLKEDGKWWDIYTDHIINKMIYSSLSIERGFEFNFSIPAETRNLRYCTYIDLMVDLKKNLKLGSVKFTDEEVIYLRKMSQAIKSRFKLTIDLVELVNNNLALRKRIIPFYRKVLKKVQPQMVFAVSSFGKETFIEACKEREIPVVEIQHCAISRYHVGYSFEDYRTKVNFPDYILSFGDYWNDAAFYPIESNKIYSIGFPELEIAKEKLSKIKKKKQIVFISQPGGGIHLSRLAADLSKIESLEYKVVYKLHPNEEIIWKEIYPLLLNTEVEVVTDEQKDLYELLAESEIQIGISSTALFEGLYFDCKTLLLDYFGIDSMEELLKSKIATKFTDLEDLVKKLKRLKTKEFDKEHFFRSKSLKNVATRLIKLMEGKE